MNSQPIRQHSPSLSPGTLAERVANVRKLAQTTLAKFTSVSETASNETILLKNGQLFGFRFGLGQFRAVWQVGADEVEIFRNSQLLQRLAIDADRVRRAA